MRLVQSDVKPRFVRKFKHHDFVARISLRTEQPGEFCHPVILMHHQLAVIQLPKIHQPPTPQLPLLPPKKSAGPRVLITPKNFSIR